MLIALFLAACGPTDNEPVETDGGGVVDDPADDPNGTLPDCVPAAPIALNEVAPSNVGALLDVEGESVDWIELTNTGSEAVDLVGWGLTDDPDDGSSWTFPSVLIAPGGFVVAYASGDDWSQVVGSWDTRVDQGHIWRYFEVSSYLSPDWKEPGFDDGGWPSAPSGFGFGDADDATEVEEHTLYVRTVVTLTAEEAADLEAVYLHVDYDDSFVAYLDGAEIARAGIGFPGTQPGWDDLADSEHEGLMYQGLQPEPYSVPVTALHEGDNVLALEVHDRTTTSSDLTLVPFLSLGFRTAREGHAATAFALPAVQLHTNFSLAASGESVALFDPAGCAASVLTPVPLLGDETYGRKPDGTGELGYFLAPTPGASNTTEMRPGFARTPTFDPAPGWYASGTDVTVDADAASVVHYTIGGAEPTESDDIVGGPLSTGTDGDAVVLRARAWEDGLWPSRIATGTWLLYEPGDLPIVSVVSDPANFFSLETGIYIEGPNSAGPPEYYGANFMEDWERPVHVEMWEPDGTRAFAVNGSMAIHGGYSRRHEQKSLLIETGGGYGDEAIEYPIFPGLDIDTFDRVLLRAGGNDWHGCMEESCSYGAQLRDPVMHAITAGEDVDVMSSRPAEMYLNGEYWGIHYLNERPDDSYLLDHFGEEEIDLLEANAQPVDGDALHWLAMLAYLRDNDLSDPDLYAHVHTLMDVDEYASYLAFEVFFDNTDWPGNNVKVWRPHTDNGRWRWMMYDTDFGLGLYGVSPEHDSLAAALAPDGPAWPNPPWSTELFRLLVTSPEFTEAFVNRYADYLNTILLPSATTDVLHAAEDAIAPAIDRHVERWGSWTDGVVEREIYAGAWQNELYWIDEWLTERPDHARQHLLTSFGLEGTWTLDLAADPPGAGSFQLTAVAVEAPFTGTYFQGIPVTITAIPAAGFTFTGWSDPSLGADRTVTLDSNGPAKQLTAAFD